MVHYTTIHVIIEYNGALFRCHTRARSRAESTIEKRDLRGELEALAGDKGTARIGAI